MATLMFKVLIHISNLLWREPNIPFWAPTFVYVGVILNPHSSQHVYHVFIIYMRTAPLMRTQKLSWRLVGMSV